MMNKLNSKYHNELRNKYLILITLFLTSILIITNFTITVIACHCVGTYESDFETPKTTFMQGEIVYCKVDWEPAKDVRLRVRDPSNNAVFSSNPMFGNEIKCAYYLNENSPAGIWNVQQGLYINDSWEWQTVPGDIFYFNVIASPTYIINTDVTGIGTITKNPNQEGYKNGTLVILTAVPDSGWKFNYWSGDLSGSNNPINININSNISITANFIKKYNVGSNKGNNNNKPDGDLNVVEEQSNMLPIANSGGVYEGFVNNEIFFNGSLSYDLDGYITQFSWDFGDGTIDVGKTVYHNYLRAGDYTVYLNVTDNNGSYNISKTTVKVIQPNRPPSYPEIYGPINVIKDVSYYYKIVSNDPDDDLIKYIIYWDDGNNDESIFISSGKLLTINHIWKKPGIYTIKVDSYDGQLISQSELNVKVDETKYDIAASPLMIFTFIPFVLPLFFVFIKNNYHKKVKKLQKKDN